MECRKGCIIHIGLDLFTEEIKQEYPLISRFVERHMLEAEAFRYSDARISTRGFVSALYGASSDELVMHISTMGNGNGSFSVLGHSGKELFSITFPLQIEVLAGMDKIELENFFIEDLLQYPVHQQAPDTPTPAIVAKGIYAVDKGFYSTENVRNVAFYRKNHGTYLPLCEPSLPHESAMTLFTGHVPSKGYTVHLTQNRYGYDQKVIDIPLLQLLQYCIGSGCTPYVGVEEVGKDEMVATLFMVHQEYGYCHSFKFTLPLGLLDQEEGMMRADAYTYTPIYNVRP